MTVFFSSLLILIVLSPPWAVSTLSTTPRTTDVCHCTRCGTSCGSMLPECLPRMEASTSQPTTATPFHLLHCSINRSLQATRKSVSLLDTLLSSPANSGAGPCNNAAALRTCRQMADDSAEFMEMVSDNILYPAGSADRWLASHELPYRAMIPLSAVITNTETCLDGLREVGCRDGDRDLLVHLTGVREKHGIALQYLAGALASGVPASLTGRHHGHEYARWASQASTSDSTADVIRALTANVPPNRKVLVAADGAGGANFTTIGAAVEYGSRVTDQHGSQGSFVIFVREGLYREIATVRKDAANIILVGDGINRTVMVGTLSVIDTNQTFTTATLAVEGQGFVAIGVTFRNTAGPEAHQAVAVRNSANQSVFYRCSFEAYQDTLYAHRLLQFYRECDIYGTVDFIFGDAAAVFQNCNIYPRRPLPGQNNTITAQGRKLLDQITGFSFHNCTVKPAPDLVSLGSTEMAPTFLGRPWKEYSTTVFMQSYLDGFLNPEGWSPWNGNTSNLGTIYYGEYQNYGAGANVSARVTWSGYHPAMTEDEAYHFTVHSLCKADVWLGNASIPFVPGLI